MKKKMNIESIFGKIILVLICLTSLFIPIRLFGIVKCSWLWVLLPYGVANVVLFVFLMGLVIADKIENRRKTKAKHS